MWIANNDTSMRLTCCWIFSSVFPLLFIIGSVALATGDEDICKQQAQSSFQLRRLKKARGSKRCLEQCCQEKHCHAVIHVKKHCYAITCVRRDLCQLVFEQLLQFQGHRMDRRDIDTDTEVPDIRKVDTVYNTSGFDPIGLLGQRMLLTPHTREGRNGTILDTEDTKLWENSLSFSPDADKDLMKEQSIPSLALFEDKALGSPLIQKRSITTDASDDDDSDDNTADDDFVETKPRRRKHLRRKHTKEEAHQTCGRKNTFQKAVLPERKKNYEFKHLSRKPQSLASCSKKCCNTEDCILSFLVMESCVGILCSGDGNCHTKRDKLPRLDINLALGRSREDRPTRAHPHAFTDIEKMEKETKKKRKKKKKSSHRHGKKTKRKHQRSNRQRITKQTITKARRLRSGVGKRKQKSHKRHHKEEADSGQVDTKSRGKSHEKHKKKAIKMQTEDRTKHHITAYKKKKKRKKKESSQKGRRRVFTGTETGSGDDEDLGSGIGYSNRRAKSSKVHKKAGHHSIGDNNERSSNRKKEEKVQERASDKIADEKKEVESSRESDKKGNERKDINKEAAAEPETIKSHETDPKASTIKNNNDGNSPLTKIEDKNKFSDNSYTREHDYDPARNKHVFLHHMTKKSSLESVKHEDDFPQESDRTSKEFLRYDDERRDRRRGHFSSAEQDSEYHHDDHQRYLDGYDGEIRTSEGHQRHYPVLEEDRDFIAHSSHEGRKRAYRNYTPDGYRERDEVREHISYHPEDREEMRHFHPTEAVLRTTPRHEYQSRLSYHNDYDRRDKLEFAVQSESTMPTKSEQEHDSTERMHGSENDEYKDDVSHLKSNENMRTEDKTLFDDEKIGREKGIIEEEEEAGRTKIPNTENPIENSSPSLNPKLDETGVNSDGDEEDGRHRENQQSSGPQETDKEVTKETLHNDRQEGMDTVGSQTRDTDTAGIHGDQGDSPSITESDHGLRGDDVVDGTASEHGGNNYRTEATATTKESGSNDERGSEDLQDEKFQFGANHLVSDEEKSPDDQREPDRDLESGHLMPHEGLVEQNNLEKKRKDDSSDDTNARGHDDDIRASTGYHDTNSSRDEGPEIERKDSRNGSNEQKSAMETFGNLTDTNQKDKVSTSKSENIEDKNNGNVDMGTSGKNGSEKDSVGKDPKSTEKDEVKDNKDNADAKVQSETKTIKRKTKVQKNHKTHNKGSQEHKEKDRKRDEESQSLTKDDDDSGSGNSRQSMKNEKTKKLPKSIIVDEDDDDTVYKRTEVEEEDHRERKHKHHNRIHVITTDDDNSNEADDDADSSAQNDDEEEEEKKKPVKRKKHRKTVASYIPSSSGPTDDKEIKKIQDLEFKLMQRVVKEKLSGKRSEDIKKDEKMLLSLKKLEEQFKKRSEDAKRKRKFGRFLYFMHRMHALHAKKHLNGKKLFLLYKWYIQQKEKRKKKQQEKNWKEHHHHHHEHHKNKHDKAALEIKHMKEQLELLEGKEARKKKKSKDHHHHHHKHRDEDRFEKDFIEYPSDEDKKKLHDRMKEKNMKNHKDVHVFISDRLSRKHKHGKHKHHSHDKKTDISKHDTMLKPPVKNEEENEKFSHKEDILSEKHSKEKEINKPATTVNETQKTANEGGHAAPNITLTTSSPPESLKSNTSTSGTILIDTKTDKISQGNGPTSKNSSSQVSIDSSPKVALNNTEKVKNHTVDDSITETNLNKTVDTSKTSNITTDSPALTANKTNTVGSTTKESENKTVKIEVKNSSIPHLVTKEPAKNESAVKHELPVIPTKQAKVPTKKVTIPKTAKHMPTKKVTTVAVDGMSNKVHHTKPTPTTLKPTRNLKDNIKVTTTKPRKTTTQRPKTTTMKMKKSTRPRKTPSKAKKTATRHKTTTTVKPSKPTKRPKVTEKKRKRKKKPTEVPTINIMTGDEDLKPYPPLTTPTHPKSHKKAEHGKNAHKSRNDQDKKKEVKEQSHKDKHLKEHKQEKGRKEKNTGREKEKEKEKETKDKHEHKAKYLTYTFEHAHQPTESANTRRSTRFHPPRSTKVVIQPTTENFLNKLLPFIAHKKPGESSTSGVLGDLQIPIQSGLTDLFHGWQNMASHQNQGDKFKNQQHAPNPGKLNGPLQGPLQQFMNRVPFLRGLGLPIPTMPQSPTHRTQTKGLFTAKKMFSSFPPTAKGRQFQDFTSPRFPVSMTTKRSQNISPTRPTHLIRVNNQFPIQPTIKIHTRPARIPPRMHTTTNTIIGNMRNRTPKPNQAHQQHQKIPKKLNPPIVQKPKKPPPNRIERPIKPAHSPNSPPLNHPLAKMKPNGAPGEKRGGPPVQNGPNQQTSHGLQGQKVGNIHPGLNGPKTPQNIDDKLRSFFKHVGNSPITHPLVKKPPVNVVPTKKKFISNKPPIINQAPKPTPKACTVDKTMNQVILVNDKEAGDFTRIDGLPQMDACIHKCCEKPDCDLAFKKAENCYLVHCHSRESCKTGPSDDPFLITKIALIQKPKQVITPPVQIDDGSCRTETAVGIEWKKTKLAQNAVRSCPREAKGIAKRFCNKRGHWMPPDFSECVSDEYKQLKQQVQRLGFTTGIKEVSSRLEDITTQTIDNSLIFGGDLILATAILDAVAAFASRSAVEKIAFKDLKNFVSSASNLLDETNKQEWDNVKDRMKGPGHIMQALEKFGIYAATQLPAPEALMPVVTNNLVLSVTSLRPLSHVAKYIFPNYSHPFLKTWTTKRDAIILPGSLFKAGVVRVASMNYKTLSQLLPHRWNTTNHVTFTDGFRVNSKVIASTLHPKPLAKIKPPVTIILHHLKPLTTGKTKCVFWDFNVNPNNGGSWSTEGCWVMTSNSSTTICQCNHLTHFAVLTHLTEDKISAKEQAKEHTIAMMWLGVPIIIIISVGAMYTCFAWSKAPRRRHVVFMDHKPRLPDNEEIVTKTVKENFPGSPNKYLYAANRTPSPSELEWEHAWDFLTNCNFEDWKKKHNMSQNSSEVTSNAPKNLEVKKRRNSKDPLQTSEYFSEGSGDSSYFRWKHQDDFEWSKERIRCLGQGLMDISHEVSQPKDSLDEIFQSLADRNTREKEKEKDSNSFDSFSPDAISSPQSGQFNEPKFGCLFGDSTSKEIEHYLKLAFASEMELGDEPDRKHVITSRPAGRGTLVSSLSSAFVSCNDANDINSCDSFSTVSENYESGFFDGNNKSSLDLSSQNNEKQLSDSGNDSCSNKSEIETDIKSSSTFNINGIPEPLSSDGYYSNDNEFIDSIHTLFEYNPPEGDINEISTDAPRTVSKSKLNNLAKSEKLTPFRNLASFDNDYYSKEENDSPFKSEEDNPVRDQVYIDVMDEEQVSSPLSTPKPGFLRHSEFMTFYSSSGSSSTCSGSINSISERLTVPQRGRFPRAASVKFHTKIKPTALRSYTDCKATACPVPILRRKKPKPIQEYATVKSCHCGKAISTVSRKMKRTTLPKAMSLPKRTTLDARKPKEKATAKSAASHTSVHRSPSKHMQSYIALRQQCKMKETEMDSPNSSMERLSPHKRKFKSSNSLLSSKASNSSPSRIIDMRNMVSVKSSAIGRKVRWKNLPMEEKSHNSTKPKIAPRLLRRIGIGVKGNEHTRRSTEKRIFGATLRRWEGRNRLYSGTESDDQHRP